MRTKSLTSFAMMVLGLWLSAAGAWGAEVPKVEVKVDRRVELVSIVFRLAGNPEYNMGNSKSPYATEVEQQFGKFRDHAAVRMARELRSRRGIAYDAVMSLAVHLDDKLPPGPRLPLEPRPAQLEGRWTTEDAGKFIGALGDFAKESGFEEFFDKHKEQYAGCAEKLRALVNADPIVPFFDDFFGKRPAARYWVVVGMLCGGENFGVSMRYADGKEEITPVIGIYGWDAKGLPTIGAEVKDTIIHEFCHSYTNAIVNAHWGELEKAGDALFKRNADVMRRQAYPDGKTLMYESLVRGCVARGMARFQGERAGQRQAFMEACNGFSWTPDLAGLLKAYEGERTVYRAFEDFMPRVVKFFNDTSEHYAEMLMKYPQAKMVTPGNGARNVDAAATKELVIAFDRPMAAGGWSLMTLTADRMPQFGRPAYNAARTELRVPMTLASGKSYVFGLNGARYMGFASEEGYPLLPLEVKFETK